MRTHLGLLLVVAAGAAASNPLDQHSSLEGYERGLRTESDELFAPSEEALKHKRDQSDRRFTSLKHLARNLAVLKANNAEKAVEEAKAVEKKAAHPARQVSSTGHHSGSDRLEAAARKWKLRSGAHSPKKAESVEAQHVSGTTSTEETQQAGIPAGVVSPKEVQQAKLDAARPVGQVADGHVAALKAKMKNSIEDMHSALHATEKDAEAHEHAKALAKEREGLKEKRLAAEDRKKVAEKRTAEATSQTLRARAAVANKKFEDDAGKREADRAKKAEETAAHDKMVAYRIAQEKAAAEKKKAEEEVSKKAEEEKAAAEAKAASEAEETHKAADEERAPEVAKAPEVARPEVVKGSAQGGVKAMGVIIASVLTACAL